MNGLMIDNANTEGSDSYVTNLVMPVVPDHPVGHWQGPLSLCSDESFNGPLKENQHHAPHNVEKCAPRLKSQLTIVLVPNLKHVCEILLTITITPIPVTSRPSPLPLALNII